MDDFTIAAIIIARLAIPLLIPRFPLAIIAALILDGIDNSLFAAFTDVDLGPDGPYQSFDKALDIYYLSIAYLSAMRNWSSHIAFRIAQFLFYYRLVGVVLFELLDERTLLLIFPNTFEYFFIAYEAIRLRFDPTRRSARFWFLTAAGIWIFIKLPQEYWIHVAQLDFTEAVADHPWFGVLFAVVIVAAIGIIWWRMPEYEHGWTFRAEPIPRGRRRTPHVAWNELAEKALLLALLGTIFASILPTVQLGAFTVALGVAAIVCLDTAISTWSARRGRVSFEGTAGRFAALLGVNLGFVYLGTRLLSNADTFPLGTGLFFAFLITLVIWLYDVYRPVFDARFADRV